MHTANLIYVDWNNKSQGLWIQDFPWKDPNCPSKACGFENDLIDYLCALKVTTHITCFLEDSLLMILYGFLLEISDHFSTCLI